MIFPLRVVFWSVSLWFRSWQVWRRPATRAELLLLLWWSQNMSTRFLLLSPFRNALVALELKLLSTRLFVYYLLALLLLCHTILKVQFSSKSRFFTFLISFTNYTHYAKIHFLSKNCILKKCALNVWKYLQNSTHPYPVEIKSP